MKELEREGKLWLYESTDPDTGRLQDVKVWDSIWPGQPRFVNAKEATVGFKDGQAWLTLYDGITYEPVSDSENGFRVTAFAEDQIALDFKETLERTEFESKSTRNMPLAKLKDHISEIKARLFQNQSKPQLDRLRYAQVEYHKKFSIPFACVVFGLIGVPLGLVVKRSGKMVGFGIGLGLVLIYYLLLQVGQDTGRTGVLPPGFAIWLPNLAIGLLGLGCALRVILEGKLETPQNRDQESPPPSEKPTIQEVGEPD